MAAVERLEAGGSGTGSWSVVHTDADWSTRFEWGRPHALSTLSFATVSWHVPPGTPPGTYRLRHLGNHKPWFGRWVEEGGGWRRMNVCRGGGTFPADCRPPMSVQRKAVRRHQPAV